MGALAAVNSPICADPELLRNLTETLANLSARVAELETPLLYRAAAEAGNFSFLQVSGLVVGSSLVGAGIAAGLFAGRKQIADRMNTLRAAAFEGLSGISLTTLRNTIKYAESYQAQKRDQANRSLEYLSRQSR